MGIAELRVQAPSDQPKAAAAYRTDALNVLHPLIAFFGPPSTLVAGRARTAAALPANVHLHTLRALGTDLAELSQRCDPFASLKSCADAIALARHAAASEQQLELLVRFQHIYAVGEDVTLSQPATVDMATFLASALPGLKIASAVETTLVAAKVVNRSPNTTFSLRALQIRTFVVTAHVA